MLQASCSELVAAVLALGGGIASKLRCPLAGLGCCIARMAARLSDSRVFPVISRSLCVKPDPGPPVLLTDSLKQVHFVLGACLVSKKVDR